jgi:hypothetical protein
MASAAVNLKAGTHIEQSRLFDEIGYSPHSALQQSIHDARQRFIVACCGRRWGKSQSAGHWMTERLFTPDTYNWIIGPTYSLAEKEFRVVYDDLFSPKKLGLRHPKIRKGYNVRQGSMYIELPWNTYLLAKSADKPDESLVGEGLSAAIMSEAAKHKSDTWVRYIEPALSDKRGECLFASTPEGFNWYKGLFDLAADPAHTDYYGVHAPSWTNPVSFPGGEQDPEIQRIKAVASKQWFDQEYGAKFTSFEGMIYDEFDRTIHVREFDYVPAWRNFQVYDFGFADPFVCLDIMVDPADNVYVWREYYIRYMATMEHGYAIKNRPNPDGFHIDAMFGDPRGADEIATLSMILGPIFGRAVPWKQGIEAVKRNMRIQPDGLPKLFIHPRCINTIKEIEGLQVKKGPTDIKNAVEGQRDKDDHTCDALRYFFSEYYVLGAGGSLRDVVQPREDETFFKLVAGEGFTYGDRIDF